MANLPSWYSEAVQKFKGKQKAWNDAVPKLTMPVRDSFHTAGGWRELGVSYSCIPDPVYPWSPEVLKAIWEFDPGVIPLWVRWAFLSPDGEVVVFGRHAIGRRVRDPHTAIWPMQVEMPSFPCNGVRFERPNLIEMILLGDPDPRAADLPGAYQPFNWNLYKLLRKSYLETSVKELAKRTIHDPEARRQEELSKLRAEQAYIRKDVEKFIEKQLDNLSEVQLRDGILGGKKKVTKPSIYIGK